MDCRKVCDPPPGLLENRPVLSKDVAVLLFTVPNEAVPPLALTNVVPSDEKLQLEKAAYRSRLAKVEGDHDVIKTGGADGDL